MSTATTVPAAPTTTATTLTTGPLSPTKAGGVASGPVPAVTGATDLSKEPTIAAATSPAPTALVGRDLVVGTGIAAVASSTVSVNYVGAFYPTGKDFDASWTDTPGIPTTFALGGVIPGFKDAIIGMHVGGRREIVIPPAYGYGATASGPIPANSTLVFVIDLVKVT